MISVDLIRQNWRQVLPHLLSPAKRRVNGEQSYICPFCSHGSHGDGLTFDPTHEGRLHCFGPCGWSGDVIDLYQALKQCDFKTAVADLEPFVGEHVNSSINRLVANRVSSERVIDYTDFFEKSRREFVNSEADEYLRARGISTQTSIKAGVGYSQKWRHPKVPLTVAVTPRLIIPTSAESYLARDVRNRQVLSEVDKRYSKQKVGPVHLYRDQTLWSASTPIFLVEGEIDALSIQEVGSEAVALGSVSNASLLIKTLANGPKVQQPIIVAMDNDESGQKAATQLLESLSGQGLTCTDGKFIAGSYKDANEALVAERKEFIARVKQAEKEAMVAWEQQGGSKKGNRGLNLISTNEYLQEQYEIDITRFSKFKTRKTGFQNLDKITSLYPGLYAIGGISSLGKTTFVHQMASQMASQGEHVLYFPIEQSPLELASKGISRTMYKINPDTAVTSIRIRSGFSNEDVMHAKTEYEEQSETLFVADCNFNTTADEIKETVTWYVEQTSTMPIVVVDYLQALRAPDMHMMPRDAIDFSLRMLKDMQTELSATVILVSSLNRVNYLVPIGFESFKESGGIEYTCDVVWGIDLMCMDDPLFDKQGRVKEKREMVDAAKVATPREVRLVCLKNRYGISNYRVEFDYIPSYDIFIPKDLTALEAKVIGEINYNSKSQVQIKKQEDELMLSEKEREELADLF